VIRRDSQDAEIESDIFERIRRELLLVSKEYKDAKAMHDKIEIARKRQEAVQAQMQRRRENYYKHELGKFKADVQIPAIQEWQGKIPSLIDSLVEIVAAIKSSMLVEMPTMTDAYRDELKAVLK